METTNVSMGIFLGILVGSLIAAKGTLSYALGIY